MNTFDKMSDDRGREFERFPDYCSGDISEGRMDAEELVREALSGSTSEVGGLVNVAFCDLSYFLCPTLGNLCYRRKA